jgi:hypothetical protein
LDGFNVRFATASGDKETRAKPVSAQAEAGNVKLVRGLWNDGFLRVLENFPVGSHDDDVDALSGAHEVLCKPSGAWDGNLLAEAKAANPHLFGPQGTPARQTGPYRLQDSSGPRPSLLGRGPRIFTPRRL